MSPDRLMEIVVGRSMKQEALDVAPRIENPRQAGSTSNVHHGVSGVIAYLCGEPAMKCVDGLRVAALENELSAARDLGVSYVQFAAAVPQRREPGHRGAVNGKRIGEIAACECRRFLAQMRPHEFDLPRVVIRDEHALRAAGRAGREDVLRAVDRERHHVFAVPFHVGQARLRLVGEGRRSGGPNHHREHRGCAGPAHARGFQDIRARESVLHIENPLYFAGLLKPARAAKS
jgi:hypothetical protein